VADGRGYRSFVGSLVRIDLAGVSGSPDSMSTTPSRTVNVTELAKFENLEPKCFYLG
jgi:hypothetical protein